MKIRRDKTALRRAELSRPLRLALESQLLTEGLTVFDFGCGHGSDVRLLRGLGFDVAGWDPAHAPHAPRAPAALVNLGFVVNVIEDPVERAEALVDAWNLAEKVLLVSARLVTDVDEIRGEGYCDGVVTRCGTFQKFFRQDELRNWVEGVLELPAIPLAPGVLAVFRSAEERERFIASRFRSRLSAPRIPISAALYAQHEALLAPLVSFYTDRGRLPSVEELATAAEVLAVFGSLPRAFAVVRRATGADAWERIAAQRGEELLLYVADAQFNRRPRFSDLAPELRGDIRAFHGTYAKAQEEALAMLQQLGDQDLLDAMIRSCKIGKQTPQALYVHASALERLPTLLRLYVACARGLVGEVEGANVLKLHRLRPQVSFLSYPEFDDVAHPRLAFSAIVNLDEARASFKDYGGARNPPVLHRKEEFITDEHPLHARFARLTASEERAGLLGTSRHIGNELEWNRWVVESGYVIAGHSLRRRKGGGPLGTPPRPQ
jgi:DNA phosphorothioation-associated putative methyltransferase